VVLRVAPRPTIDAYPLDFRIESADERIVAEAFAAKAVAGDQITFLSHDTVPLEDAAGLGMQIQVIPEDWLLDPEPSEIERELGDVKRRMKALEGRSPNIVVEVPTDKRGWIMLKSPYFPPLPDTFIATAIREVRRKHPLGPSGEISVGVGGAFLAAERIDEERWIRYAEDHGKWLAEVENVLHDTGRFLSEDPNAIKLSLSVANKGNAGAENLIVRIEALGDFHLVDPDALVGEDEPSKYLPEPPPRPRSALVESLTGMGRGSRELPSDFASRLAMPRFGTAPMARDRHAIYWEYEDDRHAAYAEGQCRDFRHGLRPCELVLSIERNVIGDEPIRGALEILVSAGNLIEAQRVRYPIEIEAELMDTEGWMRTLLKRELRIDV
jgi:hypothetical protein